MSSIMSNTRQSKWDWTSHWPQMETLYRRKLSIPKIAKAIQCEGFKPSERAVYLTFTSKGYPTNHAQRVMFLEGSFDALTDGLDIDSPPDDADESTQSKGLEPMASTPSNLPGRKITGQHPQRQPSPVATSSKCVLKSCKLDRMYGSSGVKDQDQDDLQPIGLISPRTLTRSFEARAPVPLVQDSFRSMAWPTEFPLQRTHSFQDPGSYRAGNRSSQSTVDSGYISDRGSPYTLPLEAFSSPHPNSLEEFYGLYRVACYQLHESTDQYVEISACSLCHYSSIHNLGWSAKQFNLAEFKRELKSQSELGRVNDLDAAGNTILFYAAVSGVDAKYLIALIDVGVDPYHLNAAGQNFLHWIRPGEIPLDCFILEIFNLLNILQQNRVLGQQDNDGQTVLHALAAQIPVGEHQVQLFNYFIDAGWPPTIPNRFGKTAEGFVPQKRASESRIVGANSFNTAILQEDDIHVAETPGLESEWMLQFLGEINAHNIIGVAYNNPGYVDPETGDTVINALSRVNTGRLDFKSEELLEHLRLFAAKGVSLNRHNYDGYHPLASFTFDRVSDSIETGTIMSMYLDALLWKDPERRISNHINVNMKTRDGVTALYNAAVRARLDSVRSLIEAGANVNARLENESATSILKATFDARDEAVVAGNDVLMHMFKEVISRLEHAGAVIDPTSYQERCRPELRKQKHFGDPHEG